MTPPAKPNSIMPTVRKKGNKYVFTPQQKKNVIRLYREGVPMRTGIAPTYGVSAPTIINRLVQWGAHTPQRRKRKTPVNEDYFKPPHTPESMYWAGLLLADGCIQPAGKQQARVRLQLSGRGRKLVRRFKRDVGSEYALGVRKREGNCKESWVHAITSDEMAKDLSDNFGIHPRKTGSEEVIEAVREHRHSRHFMRGLFDGDGYLTMVSDGSASGRVELAAGSDSCHESLEEYFGCRWGCYRDERDDGWVSYVMVVYGDRARHVARVLYGGLAGTTHPRLPYKRETAMRILATDLLYDDTNFNTSILPSQLQR